MATGACSFMPNFSSLVPQFIILLLYFPALPLGLTALAMKTGGSKKRRWPAMRSDSNELSFLVAPPQLFGIPWKADISFIPSTYQVTYSLCFFLICSCTMQNLITRLCMYSNTQLYTFIACQTYTLRHTEEIQSQSYSKMK